MKEASERRWVTAEEFRKAPSDDVVVQKFGVGLVKSADEENKESRTVRFVISDGEVDRQNDTIAIDGWDLSNFEKSPVVLWAHSHSQLPVAKATEVKSVDGRLEAIAEFSDLPFADDVLRLIRGGFLRASSVGFRPLEWVENEERGGIDFKRQELVEFSVVPVPANPRALVAAQKAGIDTAIIRGWLEETSKAIDEMRDGSEQPQPSEEPPGETLGAVARTVSGSELLKAAKSIEESAERMVAAVERLAPETQVDAPGSAVLLEVEYPDETDEITFEFDPDLLKAALVARLRTGITEGVKSGTHDALDYLRGRV